ncbi:helix-turn-helix transcriptional regulator [Ferdinandcohnia sp. SAFN-114]|uniref:helix-turn-helix transcriptional regulator n=1 Tax=Ferdinandcohnia sp. SAFN-114 TaxID=3387275 RepID=UPI003F7E2EC6
MESIYDEIDFLRGLIKGISSQFGPNCEVVLLDLTKYEEVGSVIVEIENGSITGRKVGDSGTNLGLEVLRGTDQKGDKHNYVTQTKEGRILRSSTMYIRNSENKPIGCICINLDITDLVMAEKTIQEFAQLNTEDKKVNEYFVKDVNELLDHLLQESQEYVGKPVALMSKEDKVKGITYLDKKGAFLIKKSSDKVCTYYDISKYSLYSYLDTIREEEERKQNQLPLA